MGLSDLNIKLKSNQITKEAEKYILEFIKCKNSFDYFCSNYVKIEVPGGDRLLKPYTLSD